MYKILRITFHSAKKEMHQLTGVNKHDLLHIVRWYLEKLPRSRARVT